MRLNLTKFKTIMMLTPIFIKTNFDQPQINMLLLYEKHYCPITTTHTQIKKDSYTKHVFNRSLAAFSSESILMDQIGSCIKQQLIKISL